MAKQTANRRKTLLINPRFQLSFIGYMVGVSMATTMIFYGAVYYFFWKFRTLGTAVGLAPDHVFFTFINEQQSVLNWGFLVVGAIAIGVLVASGVYLSQRVAGPLHRLQGHMKRVASGETTDPVKFRDRDFFPELAAAYNESLAALTDVEKPRNKKSA